MAGQSEVVTVVEVLMGLGIGTGVTAGWKWLFGGRNRQRVDNAVVASDLAMKAVQVLLEPVTKQAANLRLQLDACEARAEKLEQHLEQVLGYAILAHTYLIGDPAAPRTPSIVLDHVQA